jgi:tetratricopeptide (TPR) repeat protein
MRSPSRTLTLALCSIGTLLAARPLGAADEPAAAPPSPYLAVTLDQEGKVSAALPLYQARAEQTLASGDRLRYAEALLRAGRQEEARKVYDLLAAERGSVEHGDSATNNAALSASSMLRAGFPALAVDYVRPAFAERPHDRRLGLLLVRALTAAGDTAGARATMARLGDDTSTWPSGERIELARWRLATGDVKTAHALLEVAVPESVGQMVHDSVRANTRLAAHDWVKTSDVLAAAERKGPRSLDDARVDRAWRNLQRELRWIQLRRAVSLWKQGKRPAAIDEATRARRSDEEYVRASATLLLVADDLAADRRADATDALRALAGHDVRFAAAAERLGAADPAWIAELRAVLVAQDGSADFVTTPLVEIVSDAVAPAPLATTARMETPAP